MEISAIKCKKHLLTIYLKGCDQIIRLPGTLTGYEFYGSLSSLCICDKENIRPADGDEKVSFMRALSRFDNHELIIYLQD